MSLVYLQLRAAVEAAAPNKLATVMSAIAQAYGAGGLTDDEYEQLDGLLAVHRRVAQAVPTRAQPLALVVAQAVSAAAPPPRREGTAPARAHSRIGSRPRTPESKARRRHWAAAGFLPPKLAASFTQGEQAVLAVVGKEIATKGRCTLAVGHIAALAGVSTTTVRRAMRQAALVGLVAIETRRVTGFRNDTNRITIASSEWASWLRLRLPRSARADLGIASQFAVGTDTGVRSKGAADRFRPAQGPVARAQRPTRPAVRGAVA
ncbi:hypothetical protein MKL09_21920 [Methylobacterium sp. J-048]|uniref:hypothetical protein n=1 Tax=Methylobacterium sp. J-048 TaxID=2836635 RepID=UPI001FB9FA4F|nr:hypothetical protein [Methylobacterium sp. J-048]MCJ2059185.1 hypothetical protein [Methylobacterium sp. J-048]